MLEWELDLKSVDPPSVFFRLKELMLGYTLIYFDEVARMPEELSRPFQQPNPEGVIQIELVFRAHPNSVEIRAELKRVTSNLQEWIEDY